MNKKQELLDYVSRLIDQIELKWNREDLKALERILILDNFTSRKEPQFFWESLPNLIK